MKRTIAGVVAGFILSVCVSAWALSPGHYERAQVDALKSIAGEIRALRQEVSRCRK